MALAHFWMKSLGRDAKALPASTAVYYLKREAEFAPEQYMQRTSLSTKDREDLRHTGTRNLPAWAEDNPGKFFSAAEQYEGVNRYHAVMLQFSLPKEMTHAQHLALTNDFIDATMPDKPLLWVKHEPLDKFSGEPQPHIHILLSARKVDGIARDAEQTFRRWNAHHPERGGCEKDLFWSRRPAPEQLRQAFADLTNFHAERLGLRCRIDSRSLRRRDIDRKPMYAAEDRPSREALAHEETLAAASWEHRKTYRGYEDISTLPREEFVAQIRANLRNHEQGRALPRVSEPEMAAYRGREREQLNAEMGGLQESIAQLDRDTHRLHAEIMITTHRERQADSAQAWKRGEQQEKDVVVEKDVAQQSRTRQQPSRSPALVGPRRGASSQAVRGVGMDDDATGGLEAPDLHRKRGREEGWEL